MLRIENGRQPYTDTQIDAALVRAGVVPPQRSLQQTRTVKSGQVAAAGTIGAGAIGAIAVMLWARIDDRRKGLR